MKKVDKPCEECGVMMQNVYSSKRFCTECRAQHDAEAKVRRRKRENAAKEAAKQPKQLRRRTIGEVVTIAEKYGLSYGMAVVKFKM